MRKKRKARVTRRTKSWNQNPNKLTAMWVLVFAVGFAVVFSGVQNPGGSFVKPFIRGDDCALIAVYDKYDIHNPNYPEVEWGSCDHTLLGGKAKISFNEQTKGKSFQFTGNNYVSALFLKHNGQKYSMNWYRNTVGDKIYTYLSRTQGGIPYTGMQTGSTSLGEFNIGEMLNDAFAGAYSGDFGQFDFFDFDDNLIDPTMDTGGFDLNNPGGFFGDYPWLNNMGFGYQGFEGIGSSFIDIYEARYGIGLGGGAFLDIGAAVRDDDGAGLTFGVSLGLRINF